jgi:hypothetical protein
MRAVQVTRPKGPLEVVEREIPEPSAGSVRIKVEACGICHSDVVTNTRVCRDMRSPESSMRWVWVLSGGHKANESESAGTAGTVILAAAAILSCAKSRPKFPASPTTAATPNSWSLPPAHWQRAAEAYEHMMIGKARFRAVLTTGH